jgi:hypothetical protein
MTYHAITLLGNRVACLVLRCRRRLYSISNTRAKAVSLTPDSHPDKPTYLNDLGISLQSRFVCLGELKDLDESFNSLKKAISLTPNC